MGSEMCIRDRNWNQSWEDYNINNINLTSDYIGPQSYQGLGGIRIPDRDIDSDSMIAIFDNLPSAVLMVVTTLIMMAHV